MFKRAGLFILIAVAAISLTACVMEFDKAGGMAAGVLKEYKETVELSDKHKSGQAMELNMEMNMAKAVLEGTAEKLADVRFSYNSEEMKPDFRVEADEISIVNKPVKHNFGKVVNLWDVKLTDKLPFDLELKADASDLKFDMTDMLIKSADATLNASTARFYFNKPNKEQLDKFKLNADASNVNIYGAGNIGFEKMSIDANASKLTIDLTGDNARNGEVRIDANASSVRLKLPDNVGVQVLIDNNEISSVRVNNSKLLSRSEKEYVTQSYEKADITLKIYVDMNVTTLTLE